MRFRTALMTAFALALPLLHQVVGEWDCPTPDFQLRLYAKWEGKYLISYRKDDPDNPGEMIDQTTGSTLIGMGDETEGGNGTSKIGGIYIRRHEVTDEKPFEIKFSDRVESGEIPLFAPEVYGQSLKCVLKMAEDPCVLRLSWYLGHALDIGGEELAENRPVKGADSMRITCKGDLNVWDTSVMLAGFSEGED